MKVELLIVGSKLFTRSKFFINVREINVTLLELPRGKKTLVFELYDQQGKIMPLSHGLVAETHLCATNLTFKTQADQDNFNNDGYRGKINLRITIFDSDTFMSHEEQIKAINNRLDLEVQKYIRLLNSKDTEADKRIASIQEPYEKRLAAKEEKIQELNSRQFITAIKFEEQLISLIEKSINEDLSENLGIDITQLDKEGKTMFTKAE